MTKLTRKLFVSIMTLVLTVMALGTSTFAWFSMNTTANATDMVVTAKSNATYLFIGSGTATDGAEASTFAAPADAAAVQALALTTTTLAKSDLTLAANNDRYPAYFNKTAGDPFPGTMAEGATAPTTAANTWYTASNKSSAAAQNQVVNVSAISSSDLNKYTVKYTAYLTLSPDSEPYAAGNYVKLTFSLANNGQTTADASVSAVVCIEGTYYKLNNGTNNGTATAYHSLTNPLTNAGLLPVDIYVYVDGTSANVNSDYVNAIENNPAHTLTGLVGIQFDLTFAENGQPQQGQGN